MKKHELNFFIAVLALFCAFASVFASAGAIIGLRVLNPLLTVSVILAFCAGIFGIIAAIPMKKLLRSLQIYGNADNRQENASVDLAGFVAATNNNVQLESLKVLDLLMVCLNEDIALLQRSAIKFDLFSSDIVFSAQNLSAIAIQQVNLFKNLRTEVVEFFESQARTNDELSLLKERMSGNALLANQLAKRANDSRTELIALLEKSRHAAGEAKSGENVVGATDVAALELTLGLKKLNETARKESDEVKHISESLGRITDIVERTHVLATNASIEAARAGSRGTGFAVIATEIRNLSASSRSALEDIDRVLGSVINGINESSVLVSSVSASAKNLSTALQKTRVSFDAIGGGILDVGQRLEQFDNVFAEQIDGASRTSASAREAESLLNGFTKSFQDRAANYESIVKSTRETETSAIDAKRSASVLAQLAGYLKAGGADRNKVLRKYRVDADAGLSRHGRKERREELLYNLEAFDSDNNLLGYLGDLSRSGLLLITSKTFEAGKILPLRIILPISTEGERSITITATVRRIESNEEGYRIGCSFDKNNAAMTAQVEEILQSLSLGGIRADGNEAVELEEL